MNLVNSLVTLTLPVTAIPQAVDGDTASVSLTVPGIGTPTTFSNVKCIDGEWTVTITPTASGLLVASWTVSPAANPVPVTVTTTTTVEAAYGLISLPDARQMLRLLVNNTDDDAMIQELIASATDLIEDVTGPMVPRVYTEHHDGGTNMIRLMRAPAIQVLSVTESFGYQAMPLASVDPLNASATSTAWCYYFNPDLNVIERRTVGMMGSYFMPGQANITVVYQAGRASVPAAVQHACRMLVKHLYEMTMPISGRRRDAEDGMDVMMGFAMPGSVLEMLQPYRRAPGIA